MNDNDIARWPNLGPKSVAWLRDAGIETCAELRRSGAVAAYLLVRSHQPRASLNLLWALAAGMDGRSGKLLSDEEKSRLREELREVADQDVERSERPGRTDR